MREARPETTADAIPSSTLLDTRCQSLVYSLGLYKNEAQNPRTSMGSKRQKDSLSSGCCHCWMVASWGISSGPDQCDGKSVCTNALSQWFTKDGNQVKSINIAEELVRTEASPAPLNQKPWGCSPAVRALSSLL